MPTACRFNDIVATFGYVTVLEGAIGSQVNDGRWRPTRPDRACRTAPGPPRRQRNASETLPAKLLAVFVGDTNETELTIPFGNW